MKSSTVVTSIIFLIFNFFATAQVNSAVRISSDTESSNAGFFKLSWYLQDADTDEDVQFIIQESTTAAFDNVNIVYKGVDLSTVLSGKNDGEYFYRAKRQGDPTAQWSNAVKVTVAHHSLQKAVGFFIAGLIVFVAILAAISLGSRHTKIQNN